MAALGIVGVAGLLSEVEEVGGAIDYGIASDLDFLDARLLGESYGGRNQEPERGRK